MYIFRLFNKDDALTPIDARFLADGVLTVGRDPASDWVMIDPDREISRSHLTMRVENGQILLHCTGANGVFDAATEDRLPIIGEDIPLTLPQSFCSAATTLPPITRRKLPLPDRRRMAPF